MSEACQNHGDTSSGMQFQVGEETCSLDLAKISPDGNCLFSALAHQMIKCQVNSEEHKQSAGQIRAEVVNYIRNDLSLFEHELKGAIYHEKSIKGENGKIGDFETESLDFLANFLSKNSYWGGSESIKAVSLQYKVNILLFNENDAIYFANSFQSEYTATLLLAYRLDPHFDAFGSSGSRRNHYDSVTSIDTEHMIQISGAMASRASKNLMEGVTAEFFTEY